MNQHHHSYIENDAAALDTSKPAKVILLVEDQDHIRQLIKLSLAPTQHKIYEASDCQTALHLARTLKPDLMLLDIVLSKGADTDTPTMTNGLDLCRIVKDTPELAYIPIVVVSSRGQTSDIKKGLAAGANEYIVKPFSVIHLMEVAMRQLSAITNDGGHKHSAKHKDGHGKA